MHACVTEGEFVGIQTRLQDTGVAPGADGYADWQMNTHRVQFSVEIENVPAGIYTLRVAGTDVGVIQAVQSQSGVSGRTAFRDPAAYGMGHLDFEPRGGMVEVLDGDDAVLQIQFPAGE